MSQTLTCRFRLVTPAFLSEDSHQCAQAIRPPSLKGALRFWWRALNWSRVSAAQAGDTQAALRQLHRDEGALFGAAGDEHNSAQSRVRLRVRHSGAVPTGIPQQWAGAGGIQYLAGLGLYHFRDGFRRQALLPTEFELLLMCRGLSDDQRSQLEEAVLALGLLGGLGSRARKGFGSLALQALDGASLAVPETLEEYRQALRRFARPVQGLPPFTAFSASSRIDLQRHAGADASAALNRLGREMALYRGYGFSHNGSEHRVLGQKAEQNFADDHHRVYAAIREGHLDKAPRRSVFGLPHNYQFRSLGGAGLEIQPEDYERRGSPLFMHLHQLPGGELFSVLTLLPAQFLPEGKGIQARQPGARKNPLRVGPAGVEPDWQVIHRFMERFEPRETLIG